MFRLLISFIISLILMISPFGTPVSDQLQVSEQIEQSQQTFAVVNVGKPSSQVKLTETDITKKAKLTDLQNISGASSQDEASDLTIGANNKESEADSSKLSANDQNNGQQENKPAKVSTEPNPSITVGSGLLPGGQAIAVPVETKTEKRAEPVPQDPTPDSNGKIINTDKAESGLIGIRYFNQSGKRMKVMIEKDDTRYTYNLKGDNSFETFPLQSDSGEYTISILENTEGKRYRYIIQETISVNFDNVNAAYLNSIQIVNWNKDMAAIKKAAALTANISSEEDKVKNIYDFVINNISYDYDKLNSLPSTYLPVIDDTLKSQSGICYDFASLMAAMLRSSGIPTKLVMGYAEGVNGYHAWNEVYIGGRWVTIDTSYDSQMRENKLNYSMMKDSNKYKTEKEY